MLGGRERTLLSGTNRLCDCEQTRPAPSRLHKASYGHGAGNPHRRRPLRTDWENPESEVPASSIPYVVLTELRLYVNLSASCSCPGLPCRGGKVSLPLPLFPGWREGR